LLPTAMFALLLARRWIGPAFDGTPLLFTVHHSGFLRVAAKGRSARRGGPKFHFYRQVSASIPVADRVASHALRTDDDFDVKLLGALWYVVFQSDGVGAEVTRIVNKADQRAAVGVFAVPGDVLR